jgi:hypothetical protein
MREKLLDPTGASERGVDTTLGPRGGRVEQSRQPGGRDDLVQRVGGVVVGEEAL